MQAALARSQEIANAKPPETALRSVVRKNALPLVDQAIVSGTNFLTTVTIGRACGKEDLGVYSLAFSIWIVLMCVQQAIVSVPYTVFSRRIGSDDKRRLAGSVLLHFVGVALLSTIGLLAAALTTIYAGDSGFGFVLVALVCAIPFILLREFGRRLAFAHLNISVALLIDASVMLLQLGGLVTLAWLGLLTPITAIIVIGAACALIGCAMLFASRRQFIVERPRVVGDLKRHWSFGKWIVGAELTSVVHGFVIYWILAFVLGTTATGAFAACMTVVMLSNPFTLGVVNGLAPRASKAYADDGFAALMHEVRLTGLFVGAVLILFCAVVFLFGDLILTLLYGPGFAGNGYTLVALAVAILLGGLAMVAEQALRAMERTNIGFISSLCGFAVTIGASLIFMSYWGVFGAACGYALGCGIAALIRWVILFVAIRTSEART